MQSRPAGRTKPPSATDCLGKWFGEVLIRSDHATARPVEQAILGGKHDHRCCLETRILLDQGTGLVAIEPRHHDVAEDHAGLMVGDLGQRIEPILRQHDLTPGLDEKYLGTTPYRIAVVNHHDLDATQSRQISQFTCPLGLFMRRCHYRCIILRKYCRGTNAATLSHRLADDFGNTQIRIKSGASYPIPFAPAKGANFNDQLPCPIPLPAPGARLSQPATRHPAPASRPIC